MKLYTLIFIGRTSGAIGRTSEFTEKVEANNFDEAVLKLYNNYEHIRIVWFEINDIESTK